MTLCCEDKSCEISALRDKQGNVLKWVLFINAVMFVVEGGAGLTAGSTSLIADSLDMLGDALVYAFSLYVIDKEEKWLSVSALLKGSIMMMFALSVMTEAGYKILNPAMPVAETIGVIGLLALFANTICVWLLWSHRSDDINMSSVWLCSRNDIIANTGVIIAGACVALTASRWPDIIAGIIISLIVLRSSLHVIRTSRKC